MIDSASTIVTEAEAELRETFNSSSQISSCDVELMPNRLKPWRTKWVSAVCISSVDFSGSR